MSSSQIGGLISYFKGKFNPEGNFIAVDTSTTNTGGVTFNWMVDGTAAPNVATYYRFLPNENWKDAFGMYFNDPQDAMAQTIFTTIEGLKSLVGWHPPGNDEVMVGQIIPYRKNNVNITFTPPPGYPKAYLKTSAGNQYAIDQAAPWSYSSHSYLSPDMNPSDGTTSSFVDERLFQALNFYLRNDPSRRDVSNLQSVANQAVKNSDGSIGFGTAPYRGEYLGAFLMCAATIGTPNLPGGITVADVENTIWGLQDSSGGIARNYTSFTAPSPSDDETTNAALLGVTPGAAQYLSQIRASGIYSITSMPTSNPVIAPTSGGGGSSPELEVTDANYNPFPLQNIAQPIAGQTITVKLTSIVPPPPPSIKRVIFSMGENANWDPVNGFSEQSGAKVNCPYLTSLAGTWGIAKEFHGLTKNSFPNYCEEAFGSDYGITTDVNPPQPVLQGVGSIESLCAAKGIGFHAFMQSQPASNPYTDSGSGTSFYIAHHNPWAYVWNVLATYNSKGVNSTLPSSASSLPKGYNWVGPNGYYSGHTPNNIANFDAWVKSYYGALINSISSGVVTDTVIILCIDNGYTNNLQTYCVIIGPGSKGKSSTVTYGHADILATVEHLLGLGNLGKDDAKASVMSDLI